MHWQIEMVVQTQHMKDHSHIANFQHSVLQVNMLDLSVRQTLLIPGQFVRRVVKSPLCRCTQQLST